MYETEWLPSYISIGLTPEQFWKMNPRKLKPYIEAEKIREERVDTQMWLMGRYVYEAVGAAVGSILSPKGKKGIPYRDTPLLRDVKAQRGVLSEEEKMKRVNAIFNSLQIMKINYELEHKKQEA